MKSEKDEKGDTIYRIIPVEHSVACAMKRVEMVCVRENGAVVKDVQARLGHSNISTTLPTYTHTTDTMASRSLDIFEKAASI